MREEFVFTWKKWNAESKGQTFFLLIFQFSLFSSLSPFFFMCMCTGGAYMTAFVHIRTHVRGVVIYVSYVFLHRHKLNGNLPAWLSAIVCWAKISEAKPALANSDIIEKPIFCQDPLPCPPTQHWSYMWTLQTAFTVFFRVQTPFLKLLWHSI